MILERQLAVFVDQYLHTALSLLGEEDQAKCPAASKQNLADAALQWVKEECQAFLTREDVRQIAMDWDDDLLSKAAIDFYLTRNRHGAGFWDGDWPQQPAKVLTDASHQAGSGELYVGDDGKIYAT